MIQSKERKGACNELKTQKKTEAPWMFLTT